MTMPRWDRRSLLMSGAIAAIAAAMPHSIGRARTHGRQKRP